MQGLHRDRFTLLILQISMSLNGLRRGIWSLHLDPSRRETERIWLETLHYDYYSLLSLTCSAPVEVFARFLLRVWTIALCTSPSKRSDFANHLYFTCYSFFNPSRQSSLPQWHCNHSIFFSILAKWKRHCLSRCQRAKRHSIICSCRCQLSVG